MRVIIANRFFSPDQSATSRMVSSLARGLAGRGFEVHVVASRQSYDGTTLYPPRGVESGAMVHRVWTTNFGRRRLFGRAVDYLTYHLSLAWRVRRLARSGDIAIACTDPPLASVTVLAAILGTGARLVNWLHDLFPEAATRLGLVNDHSHLCGTLIWLRNLSLRRAACNVTPIPAMATHLISLGIPAPSFTVIRQWSEGDAIHPVPPTENDLRREWGLEGKVVIGYSGNFGRIHEFDTLLNAASRLANRDDLAFLFIGDGQRRAFVEAEVARRGLRNVVMKPLQPVSVLAKSLSAADLHLVSLLPALEICSVPSKFYGVLAAGRPTLFVGDGDGEIARSVDRFGCGYSVRIGDDARLAQCIAELADQPALRQSMGQRARDAFEREFQESAGIDAWERVFAELGHRRPAPQPATGKALATEAAMGAPHRS